LICLECYAKEGDVACRGCINGTQIERLLIDIDWPHDMPDVTLMEFSEMETPVGKKASHQSHSHSYILSTLNMYYRARLTKILSIEGLIDTWLFPKFNGLLRSWFICIANSEALLHLGMSHFQSDDGQSVQRW
jgi:hypothetical protein